MSVRLAQAALPRTGAAAPHSKEESKRDPARPGASKPSAGGASAKAVAGGKSGGAQGAQRQHGAEGSEELGAHAGGFDSFPEGQEPAVRRGLSVIQGEGAPPAEQSQELQVHAAPQLTVAREVPRERNAEGAGFTKEALELRARLRTAVMERMAQCMADVTERLSRFLQAPGRLGVVNLSLVLSESSLTYEVWKAPSAVPESRARMGLALGFAPEVEDASLLRALMTEVHEAFVAFRSSSSGREALQRYEQVLRGADALKVLPVVPGHDTGPMLAELERVGIAHEAEFSRSLLANPLLLAVGLTPEEGSESQVMIAGLNVPQLGTLVAQIRRVNPRLTNRQVCQLLLRTATERKTAPKSQDPAKQKEIVRKSLGQAEVEQALMSAYQMLRLTAFEMLFV